MKKKAPKVSAKARRGALLKRIEWRTKGAGHLNFPAVPGMAAQYVSVIKKVFAAMGRPFGKGAAENCRAAIDEKITWAFERSHNATVTVDWKTDQGPTTSLTWTVTGWQQSIEDAYAEFDELVEPGGIGLFNVFLAHPGFKPTAVERDFSQIGWCPIYTREEVAQASEGHSLVETAKLVGVDPKRYLKVALAAALKGERIPLPFEISPEV